MVHTPLGLTNPVCNTGRGTVQGDALSPLLFILTIEALIQWLTTGNNYYKFKTSSQQVGPLAFADDLALTTGSAEHMICQTRKITALLRWSGLEANMDHTGKTRRPSLASFTVGLVGYARNC